MEWHVFLTVVFVALVALMFTGLPIAFCFMGVCFLTAFLLMGPFGISQLVLGMYDQVCNFTLTPIPFFMIMGEVFYQSGIISRTLDTLSKLVKKVPGRLSVITLLGGGIFAALSGSVVANTAMFGSLMLPEMVKRGYNKSLIAGSIMASGALAMIIPPSSLAVLLGSIANISVGRILIGAVVPGILLMLLYIAYVIGSCIMYPAHAPAYEVEDTKGRELAKAVLVDIIPLFFIFFLVTGLIFMGVATPTEAAALGALGAYVLTAFYRKFSFKLLIGTLVSSLNVTASILLIIAGSAGFSQILAISGASRRAVLAIMGFSSNPWVLVITMLAIVFVLGFFMEQTAIMMITLPIFMPIIIAMKTNQVWFAVMYLICLQIGQLTPPVGLALFTLKSVSPPEVTMKDIYKGAWPYVIADILAVILIMLFPILATWLPGKI